MIIEILNKILLIVLIMSCLNTFRHAYYFTQSMFTNDVENQTPYKLSRLNLVILGLSISHIITSIFLGYGI